MANGRDRCGRRQDNTVNSNFNSCTIFPRPSHSHLFDQERGRELAKVRHGRCQGLRYSLASYILRKQTTLILCYHCLLATRRCRRALHPQLSHTLKQLCRKQQCRPARVECRGSCCVWYPRPKKAIRRICCAERIAQVVRSDRRKQYSLPMLQVTPCEASPCIAPKESRSIAP